MRGDITHNNTTYLKRDLDVKKGATETIIEFKYPNSSGSADLGSKFNGKWHATEVVISCDSNINDHAKNCFLDANEQIETLTIVTLLKSEHKKILNKIMSVPELVFFVSRIRFITLEDIIKGLY
jgi:hypothetical protein